jgi:hypothetical protein
MTLNLTLLTADAIYQSADFELTDADTGQPLPDNSMKLVTLSYPTWEGFVTYTGVGRWRCRDTSDWIEEGLTGLAGASPEEIAERVRERAARFLNQIECSPGGRRYEHTFVLGCFVGGKPRLGVISNYEDASGRRDATPSAGLRIDWRGMRDRPVLIATGRRDAVPRAGRRKVERIAAQTDTSPAQIRDMLMELNAAAAKRAGGGVSEGCSVVSFRRDGQGFQSLTSGSTAQLRAVMGGRALTTIVPTELERARVVGATFARSGSRAPYPPCVPRVIEPSGERLYELVELTHPHFESAAAFDVNETPTVIGYGTNSDEPSVRHLCTWSIPSQAAELLGFTGDLGCGALNNKGQVAFSADMADGSQHAARWTPGSRPEDLGTYWGTESDRFADSGALAINNSGVVVGWISLSTNRHDRGQLHFRPAAWFPGSDGTLLLDFGFAWAQAVDVNDAGTVLVVAYTEGLGGTCKALLWEPQASTYSLVGASEPDGVYPVALTSAGSVLGNGRSRTGEPVACISEGEGWMPLGTPAGWNAVTMNDAGAVAGMSSGRPWLRRPNGEILWLPYLAHHSCQPMSLSDSGVLIGRAETDHGSHALLWRSASSAV